ncbi:MAG: exo-alpha-sialidase [Methylococcales bacterium]|nr:exo-alpha-sialidase [Methylococcales bacterium]
MFKKYKSASLSTLIYIIPLILLIGCQVTEKNIEANVSPASSYTPLNTTVSATFSADGRLWRLIPTKNAIYVDFSLDNGATYSHPVQVNKFEQTISAWPENPPAIKISSSGRINILYYADTEQKSTSFFSYSDDGGQTFSNPSLISDHAQSAMHYMDKMLVDKNNNIYLFWHDTRHESHDKELGAGVLSLYYSIKTPSKNSQFTNNFLSSGICSCCQTATTFVTNGKPVILARMVYENGIRDHALIRMKNDNTWSKLQRVTHDNWEIEACPEHGPSIAIDNENRTHLTWFTLGDIRKGIFYAQTDDFGKTISTPMALGNISHLPSHPDVIVLKKRVVIVWKEFDGEQTTLHAKESFDRGKSWKDKATGLKSNSKNGHPKLITNNTDVFLSWTTKDNDYKIIKL